MKISILEPGAWGTALGIILSQKNEVSFWYENPRLAARISQLRENGRLAGIKIPKKIFISSDLKRIIEDTDLIIVASPTFNFRKTLKFLKKSLRETFGNWPKPLLGLCKGIEKETLKLPSEIVEEIFPELPPYAHLSGPGFAKEIIRGKPAKEVIASKNKSLLKRLKELFEIKPLQILTTNDLIGVQLAGALKNTLAIGISLVQAGIKHSQGEKIQKKLIQLALKEMIKIGQVLGAKSKTFLGPAGRADLILTATSPLSRNFQFGQNLLLNAEKMRKEIIERKITVEGFNNAWAFYKLGKKYQLNLPMIEEIYKVIYKKVSPKKIIKNLIKLAEIE